MVVPSSDDWLRRNSAERLSGYSFLTNPDSSKKFLWSPDPGTLAKQSKKREARRLADISARPAPPPAAPMGDEWRDSMYTMLSGVWLEATGLRAAEDCQKHLKAFEQQLVAAGLRHPCGSAISVDVQCAIVASSLRFECRADAETMMRYHRDISISMVQELVEMARSKQSLAGGPVDVTQLSSFRPCLAAPDFDEGTRLVRETLKHIGYQVDVVSASSHVDVREAMSTSACRYQLCVSRDYSMPDIHSEDDSNESECTLVVSSTTM